MADQSRTPDTFTDNGSVPICRLVKNSANFTWTISEQSGGVTLNTSAGTCRLNRLTGWSNA